MHGGSSVGLLALLLSGSWLLCRLPLHGTNPRAPSIGSLFSAPLRDQPEMFEVPDIDLPGMEAFAPAPAPSPGGDLFPVPDNFGGMDKHVADGEQLPHGQAPDASGRQVGT